MNKQIPNGGGTPVTSETPHPELMSLQPKLAGEPLCIKTLIRNHQPLPRMYVSTVIHQLLPATINMNTTMGDHSPTPLPLCRRHCTEPHIKYTINFPVL